MGADRRRSERRNQVDSRAEIVDADPARRSSESLQDLRPGHLHNAQRLTTVRPVDAANPADVNANAPASAI